MVLQNVTPEVVWQTRISRIGANGRRWHQVHPSLHVPRQETCFDSLAWVVTRDVQCSFQIPPSEESMGFQNLVKYKFKFFS